MDILTYSEETQLMLKSSEDYDFFDALELQYGKTIPLYHATDESSYQQIKKEGLVLKEGKNSLHWGYSCQLYFQIGRSDYVDSFRSVLLKYEAPIVWLAEFAYADLDNVTIKDEDLESLGVDLESITSEMKDLLKSYVWNRFNFEGIEIMIIDVNFVGIEEIFPDRVL